MKHQSFKRVAITGIGAICGLGQDTKTIWQNAQQGKSGISNLLDPFFKDLPVRFAGTVTNFQLADELLPSNQQSRYDKFIHYALHATKEAMDMSKLQIGVDYKNHEVSCIFGVGMGGFPIIEATHATYLEKGTRRVSPFFIPGIIPNMSSGLVALHYGITGGNYSIASACASSGHAIMASALEIMTGQSKAVITGGTESVLTGLTISGFANMKALSKRNEEFSKASCPFDMKRDGFVMGEGAGILVLEELESAKNRNAPILAELIGFGQSSDAHHITAPHPEGLGAALCMQKAIDYAGIAKEEIDYINAHGTSTPLGDIAETKAIKQVFKDHAKNLKISSTKSMTGHLLGAAAGIESVFCVLALKEGIVPPTINLTEPDPECDLFYTPNSPLKNEIRYALNNSFGFGGTNTGLIFKNSNLL